MYALLERHLTYANVVATMALVFAMGGSAVAATHYLITSTSQVSPTVLKQLEAKVASKVAPGAAGERGAPGAAGAAGVPGTPGANGTNGTNGNNGVEGKQGLSLLKESEQNALKSILAHMELVTFNGQPTVRFKGANVQIISGLTEEAETDGKGNLIIGYDEIPGSQTGSNNLVIGSIGQNYSSYGAILGGENDFAEGPFSDVFGDGNETGLNGAAASVSGGHENKALDEWSSVSGGAGNLARADNAAVSGGEANEAKNTGAAVSGGFENKAEAEDSSILGGEDNVTKTGKYSVVGGGQKHEESTEWGFTP